jgi:CTP:molybdopterin cytidylyltransferase MocA
VLLGRLVFDAILDLKGDRGARGVLQALPVKMEIAVDDPGILRDLDRPETS